MPRVDSILEKKGSYVAITTVDRPVIEAAKEMNERHIGCLVVMDGANVAGIFTERDILTKMVAGHRDPDMTLIGEVMSNPVITCRPDTTLVDCRRVMTNRRIRHIPVLARGRLVGIVTIGDLLAFEVREQKETIQFLNQYISGPF